MGCVPALACRKALEEATQLWPNRRKTSDGICSSPTHQKQSPNSDHDVGNAFDLSDDLANGCDAHHLADLLSKAGDPRVKYVISNRRIWNPSRDKPGVWRPYSGSNPHTLHIHVSIHSHARGSTAAWWTPLLRPLKEDPFMALSDDEQRELLDRLRNIDSVTFRQHIIDGVNTKSTALRDTLAALVREQTTQIKATSTQHRDSLASLTRRLFGVDPVAKNDDQPFWKT